jgi:hypothetical protein
MHEGVEPRYRDEMLKRPAGLVALVALSVLLGSAAGADSIYLKNGRVIHCDWTREEGEYIVFGQYGGEARIPLHAVERVEENAETEPAPAPTLSQEEYRAALVRRYAEAGLSSPVQDPGGGAGGGEGSVSGGAAGSGGGIGGSAAGEDVAERRQPGEWRHLSPDTREYWQLRVAEIEEQKARIVAEIDRLPEYNHLEEKILDGRILWVVQEKERLVAILLDLQADLTIVREDARKAGIPPGWLRLETRKP